MKINKKVIVSAALSATLVSNLLFPALAKAYSFNVGPYSTNININEIMQEANFSSISNLTGDAATSTLEESTQSIEDRYGFNENIWKTAKRKMSTPRVDIFFDNTNPKPGEKVTAHAIPEFFKNDPQNLYYTWYIIHTEDGSVQTATNSVRNGIIEASRVMARGDYDPDLDEQNYDDPKKDPDKDGWPAVDSNSYDEDKTIAPMGGADGVGGLPEETVEAYSSATEWCDSLGDHSWDKCSYNDGVSYKPLNTYYAPKESQTNHYCQLCVNYFSGNGESAYTSAKTARNNCCYNNTPESSLQCSSTSEVTDPDTGEVTEKITHYKCPQDSNTDYCGLTYNSLFDGCYDTFKEANKSNMAACLDSEYGSCRTNWATVHEDSNGDGFSDYSEEDTTQVSRCYKHNFGSSNDAGIFRENELSDDSTSDSSGLDVSVPCKHKWINATDYRSGSGKFPTGEEEKWKTDPTDPDTDGDGFADGADVIGLGQENFTWTYQSGDRVGVVAEGTSMVPTDEKTAYYKIMWGHLDVCDSTKTGLMDGDDCDDSGDYGYGFMATKAPNEGEDEKLKVSLSYSPDNPLADPSDDNKENIQEDGTISDADQITVTSSLDSTTNNPNNLYYTWQISEGDSPSTDNWKEIKNVTDYFGTASPLNGLGIASLNFTPKKKSLEGDGDTSYFKVTLTVSTAADEKSGRGRSSVVVGVSKKGIKIKLYKVDIKDGKAVLGKEVCSEGLYKSLCPAMQYQMLAAEAVSSKFKPNNSVFSWSLNGEMLSAPANSATQFDGWSDTTVFFPVTKEERDIENISVTATSKDELQPALGSRAVTVVKPALFIKSADSGTSWPVTYTAENPDKKYSYRTIESSTAFQALSGQEASYYLSFVPDYIFDNDTLNTSIDWDINGSDMASENVYEYASGLENITLENNNRNIKLKTRSDSENQSYALGAKVKKYWGDDEKNIIYSTWGISPQTTEGDTSITLTTTKTAPGNDNDDVWGTVGQGSTTQILAAVGTHLPHYIMYLLRLALTLIVMFFLSIGFYALTQKVSLYEEK
ncbi:MAG: hypothetical protein WC831_04120 [Parcubacteria group bacterium]|jgi:hypothetical protein